MKINQSGLTHLVVPIILIAVVGCMAYVAINVTNQAKLQLKEDSAVSSNEAAKAFFGTSGQSAVPAQNSSTATSAKKDPGVSNKKIAGNSDSSVAPVLSPKVEVPKTSLDSIRTFFASVKSGDFVTANALIGPQLAASIATASGTSDPTKALSACKANTQCKVVLYSFEPPSSGYKITKYKAANGNEGEQISFPLSKSSPALASSLGDYNIDIFSEKYAGDIWVIQNLFINGSPLQNIF